MVRLMAGTSSLQHLLVSLLRGGSCDLTPREQKEDWRISPFAVLASKDYCLVNYLHPNACLLHGNRQASRQAKIHMNSVDMGILLYGYNT